MPDKLTSLSKNEETSLRKDKFKGFVRPDNIIERKTYDINNMLLEIYQPENKDKNIIALTKEFNDKLFASSRPSIYRSSIEVIKNNTVLITLIKGKANRYSFLVQDPTKAKLLSGGIQFLDGDEQKAKALLYKLLNGVTFKK